MKKQVLLDMSILKHPYCGLGQIALNYCYYFRSNDLSHLPYEITLLMPKNQFGIAGKGVKYLASNAITRFLPSLRPAYDVWHSMFQLSSFSPSNKDNKYLLTIHDLNFLYEKSDNKAQRYLNNLLKQIQRSSYITVISDFTKQELLKYAKDALKDKPLSVIYNGVENMRQSLINSQCPKQVNNDRPFFFTIGEVKEKKNFHTLVPMMQYFPNYDLYIAGNDDTDYAQQIRRSIAQLHLPNVRLLGKVGQEERLWLYEHCEAFLFPSLCEGFGLPVIEAMSLGKPAITSGRTSLKEIGAGFTYEWKDFEPLTMASFLVKALTDFSAQPDRREQQVAYALSFTYRENIETYLKLYTSLCQ